MDQHQQARETLTRIARKVGVLTRGLGDDDAVPEEVLTLTQTAEGIAQRMAALDAIADANRKVGIGAPAPEAGDPSAIRTRMEDKLAQWAVGSASEMFRLRSGKDLHWSNDTTGILQRVVQHGVAADGTAPVTIEGDLIKFVDANRYAVNASRTLSMPDNHAPTFKRPRLTQHSLVGVQSAEGDVLASQRVQLTGDTITKATFGTVLALSEQEIDWTEPALLGVTIADMAEQYAIATDAAHCAAIEAAAISGNKVICALDAASDVFIQAISDASAIVYTNSKKQPDTLFVSVDRWSYLTALTDGDGRPLFPITGSVNVAGLNAGGVSSFSGMNVMGLRVVVDPNFDDNTWIVAYSQLAEFFEQNKGLLSINVPSTLEVQWSYRGYAASNCYTQGFSPLTVS